MPELRYYTCSSERLFNSVDLSAEMNIHVSFFPQTAVTFLGQVQVRRGLSQYIPTHTEDFSLTFETPDILRQLRTVPIVFIPEAHQVVRVMLFARCFSQTNIYFRSTGAVRFYSCFINDLVGKTMPI